MNKNSVDERIDDIIGDDGLDKRLLRGRSKDLVPRIRNAASVVEIRKMEGAMQLLAVEELRSRKFTVVEISNEKRTKSIANSPDIFVNIHTWRWIGLEFKQELRRVSAKNNEEIFDGNVFVVQSASEAVECCLRLREN